MLGEAPNSVRVGSREPWQSPTATGLDTKDPGTQRRQRGAEPQRTVKKSCFLGLETRPELVWDDWDVGKELTKTLVLKNVHNKLQKLHLRPPKSEIFSAASPDIPQIIFLSPGTSTSILVTFRPQERCEYEDNIEFQSKEGSFQVRLRATIPSLALAVPNSVLLPLCAVQHSTRTTFQLRNTSKLWTSFNWTCAGPFQLSPDSGLLKPHQECNITVVFRPQEAVVYQENALCKFGEEGHEAKRCCAVLLQGPAKFPCLLLRNLDTKEEKQQGEPVLHFGFVAVGQSLRKHFEIFNPSAVTASFSLSRLTGGVPLLGSEFNCDVTWGKVDPGGSLRASVTFSPTMVGTVSVEYLCLTCRGAVNENQLKLIGSCLGPTVLLNSSYLDFGCVSDGGTVTHPVELTNSSAAETTYQWDIDCSGYSVFSIQPACGTIPPHGHITLTAVYRPTQIIAHHKRVTCLILHGDPLFLDMIGTCHSECHQPAILKPEHLSLYRQQDNAQHDSNQRDDNSAVVQKTPMEEYYQSYIGCTDHVSSSSSSPPHITVVPNELMFHHKKAFCLLTSSFAAQFVSITNHTERKLCLVWTVVQDSPFAVFPSSCDLAPLKSTSFRVTYVPAQLNTFHGAQLECFAYYKMEDRHINELCPPWCVSVRVIGHSFQPSEEHFTPYCSLNPSVVVFPGLSLVSYQTVLLQNCGEDPVTFCLDLSSIPSLAESMSVFPSCGLIQPGLHQILILRATPTEDNPKQGLHLQLHLNATNDHAKELTVVSVLETLCVCLGETSLYFQPTDLRSQTRRTHHIRNLSCLPLRFQWTIPESDQELICVEPEGGELHPNEISTQTWCFSPQEEKPYTLKPMVCFWPIQNDGRNKSNLILRVEGFGSKGFIQQAEKDVREVKDTLVGSYNLVEVPVVNPSPCAVSFCLSVQQTIQDKELFSDPTNEPCALHLDSARGNIASSCTMLLKSTFRPHRRGQYLWKISYQTLDAKGLVSSPLQFLCEVRAKGVFPVVQVTDVSGGGSLERLSKVHLWTLFSLNSLNQQLLTTPSPAELTYETSSLQSPCKSKSSYTRAMLDFNFGAAHTNSDPATLSLMFYNPGSIPVDWAVLFPEDQLIETEYWADTREFSLIELYQMKVVDNPLFSVSPRSGTLQSGQQIAVHLSYRHEITRTDRLPVVFKLSYGREILLNFQGTTLEGDIPYLHYATKKHVFTPVTIGNFSPPRQVSELHNAGGVPVHYTVDTGVLSQLQEDNFNHAVLCCLTPEAEIPPGETATVEWLFFPLEAKMYQVDVPIYIQGGEKTLVRFECRGVDVPELCPSNITECKQTEIARLVQRVPFPGQVVFLSEDTVSLGNIPVSSQFTRIFFLINVSKTETINYIWEPSQQRIHQQVVQICPEQGRLCPGESHLCVLNFTSTDYPTIYQLDIICQIIQEAALTQYHKALLRWDYTRRKEKEEFTITEKDLPKCNGELCRRESVKDVKDLAFKRYKTLPPICKCDTVAKTRTKVLRAERHAQQEREKLLQKPEPPHPTLLHLEVKAHSHGLMEYVTHFPDQLERLQRCLEEPVPVSPVPPSTPYPEAEEDVYAHVLNSLLCDTLDDSSFVHSLLKDISKPVTYQLVKITPSQEPRTVPTPPPPSQTQVVVKRSKAAVNKEHHSVDRVGAAEQQENLLQTLDTQHVPADVTEDVLLNTFQNLMMEAVRGEVDLTVQTRALPHASRSRKTKERKGKKETARI